MTSTTKKARLAANSSSDVPAPVSIDYDVATAETISAEMLDIVVTGSNQLLRSLLVVLYDLSLIRQGKKLVFPLDFYELHTFLWPEQRQSQSRQVTRTLLQSQDIEFTLLPGTAVEFIDHLKRLVSANKTARVIFDEMLQKPFVHALLRYFGTRESVNQWQVLNAVSRVNNNLRGLSNLSSALNRLEYLHNMQNLKPLDKFLDAEDEDLQPNIEILHNIELSLALRRPTARSNFVDAHNFALTWALCDAHWGRKKTIYYLITSSPLTFHAYKNFKWARFPQLLPDPTHPEFSLVRHPIQVLYLARILKMGDEGWKELKNTTENLKRLLIAWANVPTYKRFLEAREKPTAIVKLPTNKRYLTSFVNFRNNFDLLFAPVREAIESDIISEENFRRERGVNAFAIGARSGSLTDPLQFTSTRLVYSLFDRLTQLTLKTIGRLDSEVQAIPKRMIKQVDSCGLLTSNRLQFKQQYRNEFQCFEIGVWDEVNGNLLFAGDIYPDYYALWWTAGVNFAGFLFEIKRFMATARPFLKNVSKKNRSKKRKEYDGVYIFYLGGTEPTRVPLEEVHDLDPDSLIEAAKGVRISMVRIATMFGDFCYDFEAFRGFPQRVGIISHLPIDTPLSWLIEATGRKLMPSFELRRAVKRSLALMKGEQK